MSFVIAHDGDKLVGQFATPLWTTATKFTIAAWVKITGAGWGEIFGVFDYGNAAYNNATLRTAAGTTYDHNLVLKGADKRMDGSGAVSGGWELVVLTYESGVAKKTYKNSTVQRTDLTNVAEVWEWGVGADGIVIGGNVGRMKVAYTYAWHEVVLSAAEIASMVNGGAGGAGKNPATIQPVAIKFSRDLLEDASGGVGTLTLNAVGSPTFDPADNPNVESAGGGGTNATAPGGEGVGTGSGSGGDATGGSGTNATAPGGTGTGTGSGSGGDATGNTAGSASFTTDKIGNNTNLQLQVGTLIYWEWRVGNIGAAPTSVTYGPLGGIALGAGGTLTLTGLPAGAGEMIARDDYGGRWIQPGVAA